MIKQTIVITSPCRLSLRNRLMVIARGGDEEPVTRPIADMGILILENQLTTITLPLINALAAENVLVAVCDDRHIPASIITPIEGNVTQAEVLRAQCDISEPLKKQAWKQIVTSKIENQQAVLNRCGRDGSLLNAYARNVLSGDTSNREGAAARLYWNEMFFTGFTRDRDADGLNVLLNYGYSILRAATVRALIGSGLSPAFGLFHRNRYNAYPLADDVMEPYRPFVDMEVNRLWEEGIEKLNKKSKKALIDVMTCDVAMDRTLRPLSLALSSTTASLASFIKRKTKTLNLPRVP